MTANPLQPRALKILVTGFGAFPGARTNPTLAILRALARDRSFARLGIALHMRVLPVVYSRIEGALAEAMAQTQPDAVLHLGLAARRKIFTVESRAVNRIGILRADAERRTSALPYAEHGGRFALQSRWPNQQLAVAMRRAGVGAAVSIDAGDYLCNQALYLTLAASEIPAGFVHVPRLRRNKPLCSTAARAPSLQQAAIAVASVLRIIAQAARCQQRLTTCARPRMVIGVK